MLFSVCPKINQAFPQFLFLLDLFLFIGRAVLQREGQTIRAVICWYTLQMPVMARAELIQRQESDARNFFQISHNGAVSQGFVPCSAAFLRSKQGARWEVE